VDNLDLDLDALNDSLAHLLDSVPGLEDAELEYDGLDELTLVIGDAPGVLDGLGGEAPDIADATSALELPEDPGPLDPFLSEAGSSLTEPLEAPSVLTLPNPFAS
jgi:hypothetical protein